MCSYNYTQKNKLNANCFLFKNKKWDGDKAMQNTLKL